MNSVEIVSESILDNFAELVSANKKRLYRLWLITPWLAYDDYRTDPLYVIIDSLRKTTCTFTLITRPPKYEWHKRAVELLMARIKPILYHCPSLHTKLYILECNGFRASMLGSPNLTPNANKRNRELAVSFCTTETDKKNNVVRVVNELIAYARDLCMDDGVTLADN